MIRSSILSRPWFRVALPVVVVALAVLLRASFMEELGVRFPLLIYLYAVLVSAFLGGRLSGLLATLLSSVCVAGLQPGIQLLASTPQDWMRMFIFVLTGVGISWLAQVLHKALGKAAEAESLRLANEEAQAASRAKSTFLANMSHEIRTPLSAILGLTELCRRGLNQLSRRGQDVDAVVDDLSMLEDSAMLLLSLVGDVLDLSRIEAGKLELDSMAFELPVVLEKTLAAHRVALSRKAIGQKIEISEDTPRLLTGDPVRLGQVLGNLVGNAVKFTESGTIFLSVSVSDKSERGPEPGEVELHFQVADTGIGIEPALQEAIFDSFRQADSSFSKPHQGAGLGLAICRELTELMNGRIWVSSTPGLGSTFHFTARFSRCLEDSRAEIPVQTGAAQRFEPAQVLVVEDNPVNLHVFERFLTDMGHQVVAVKSGREALDILRSQGFDLVLMDVQMPGMDGVEAVRRLRLGECGERAARLPVVALTAYAMAGDQERFLAAGMTGYLAKPVTPDRLRDAVARHATVPEGPLGPEGPEGPPRPLEPLLPEAVAYLKGRLSQATSLLDAMDFPGAATAGHDIKGAAMGLALAPLLAPATAFEEACRAGDALLAAKHITEIELALDGIQGEIAPARSVQG